MDQSENQISPKTGILTQIRRAKIMLKMIRKYANI